MLQPGDQSVDALAPCRLRAVLDLPLLAQVAHRAGQRPRQAQTPIQHRQLRQAADVAPALPLEQQPGDLATLLRRTRQVRSCSFVCCGRPASVGHERASARSLLLARCPGQVSLRAPRGRQRGSAQSSRAISRVPGDGWDVEGSRRKARCGPASALMLPTASRAARASAPCRIRPRCSERARPPLLQEVRQPPGNATRPRARCGSAHQAAHGAGELPGSCRGADGCDTGVEPVTALREGAIHVSRQECHDHGDRVRGGRAHLLQDLKAPSPPRMRFDARACGLSLGEALGVDGGPTSYNDPRARGDGPGRAGERTLRPASRPRTAPVRCRGTCEESRSRGAVVSIICGTADVPDCSAQPARVEGGLGGAQRAAGVAGRCGECRRTQERRPGEPAGGDDVAQQTRRLEPRCSCWRRCRCRWCSRRAPPSCCSVRGLSVGRDGPVLPSTEGGSSCSRSLAGR